jgi:hypothetical protein
MEKIDIDSLRSKIKKLNETLWEMRVKKLTIDDWLKNFNDKTVCSIDKQEKIALYILSNFLYFDDNLIRAMLRSVFNDLFRKPIIYEIRKENNNTLNSNIIEQKFEQELNNTRFLGIGNPSESGSHLLYYFRQENNIKTNLFINTHEIFRHTSISNSDINKIKVEEELAIPDISRYIFLDDFCGTGTQGEKFSREVVKRIKALNSKTHICYFSLIGTKWGIEELQHKANFDTVSSVLKMDDTFKCFSTESRYFDSDEFKKITEEFCTFYGKKLSNEYPLGYKDCQLLIGFHHNIPNNTLPIIWKKTDSFTPVFPRYSKKYK